MKPIISVEGLGKSYTIRHEKQTAYKSLREEIFKLPQRLLRREVSREEFWALKDVSFDVMPGDRVGIVGSNGAGKSTLLKLLSRITEPAAGRVTLRGRVASLLEVGTGFHPELTGRENIFLNGAILGMSRAEVRRKFEEIVEFAGVERFLDTPVKRYSSGMYVRLAFAVAAHLESEILVVDEVLAVGDVAFQKKCIGKMESVSQGQGRTVLFVSHNLAAVRQLCDKGVLLDAGTVRSFGVIGDVCSKYSSMVRRNSLVFFSGKTSVLEKVELSSASAAETGVFRTGEAFFIKLYFLKDIPQTGVEVRLKDEFGSIIAFVSSMLERESFFSFASKDVLVISVPPVNLVPGQYFLDIILRIPGVLHVENFWDVICFEVQEGLIGNYKIPVTASSRLGAVVIPGATFIKDDLAC